MTWKLATVGLVPEDPKQFEFENKDAESRPVFYKDAEDAVRDRGYDFTEFSDAKIKDEQGLPEQMRKQLRKLLYSRRKSAEEFYGKNYSEGNDSVSEDYTEE